jgi:hypothetical protein
MTLGISKVEVKPDTPPMLSITLTNGETSTLPLHPPVVALLNAGAWMMREYAARVFENDLGSANMISRRIRSLDAGSPAEGKAPENSPPA